MEVINILLVGCENIIRYDNWNYKPIFQVLNERLERSNYQIGFYKLVDDLKIDKEFILIADTHIGNKNIQNLTLINNIYDFALKNGISNIFHLGDIFEGVLCSDSDLLKC